VGIIVMIVVLVVLVPPLTYVSWLFTRKYWFARVSHPARVYMHENSAEHVEGGNIGREQPANVVVHEQYGNRPTSGGLKRALENAEQGQAVFGGLVNDAEHVAVVIHDAPGELL
jgi:hypothetical protein